MWSHDKTIKSINMEAVYLAQWSETAKLMTEGKKEETVLAYNRLLRTDGLCWCKVILETCIVDGNQHIWVMEKMPVFSKSV